MKRIIVLIPFLWLFVFSGTAFSTLIQYQMVPGYLDVNFSEELDPTTMLFTATISDVIHVRSADGDFVPATDLSLETLALGHSHYFLITEWDIVFSGSSSFLGSYHGDSGGFDFFFMQYEDRFGWWDGWAWANGSVYVDMPPFWWTSSFADPESPDFLKLPGNIGAAGSFTTDFGEVTFAGDFNAAPVPEPSTLILLSVSMLALVAGKKIRIFSR